MQFTPLADFFSDEFQCQYLAGFTYTVRPEDKKLAALVPQWIEQGKIKPGAPDAPSVVAKVAGAGHILLGQ